MAANSQLTRIEVLIKVKVNHWVLYKTLNV